MPNPGIDPQRSVGEGRQATYTIGLLLTVVGALSFFSVFVTAAMNFGDFSNFESDARLSMTRAIVGMALMIVGGLLRNVGARGLAGSGVVLDPERARRDVEPWARMGGGLLKDALDEADIDLSRTSKISKGEAEDFEARLRKLHRLHADGILTDEEYAREKREVLDQL